MSENHVLEADVLDGTDDGDTDERPSRRPTAGPIIAVVVVMVILAAAGIYFFWGTSVTSVKFLNDPMEVADENGKYGVSLSMLALSKGAQTVDGKGALDISFASARVHTQQVNVKKDRADVVVEFTKFVTENGEYTFTFSMEGMKATSTIRINHVPVGLELNQTENQNRETGETRYFVLVSPLFKKDDPAIDLSDYSKRYSVKISMIDPTGTDEPRTLTLYELLRDPYSPILEVEGDYMGLYTISAEMENSLVKPTSEHRRISSEPSTLDIFVNRAPVITDFSYPERAKKGSEVEFRISASDPDQNGGIDYLLFDWDLKDAGDDFQEFQDYNGGMLRVKHTFTQAKQYVVFVTVGDNGEIEPGLGEPTQKRFAYRQVNVTVTLI
jgi:hypothetical protein